jgi:hypothetical protein
MASKNDAKELKSLVEQGKEATRQLNAELKTTKALAAETLNPFESLVGIFDKLEQHKSRENQLSSDQLKKLSERVKLEKENLINSEKALDARLGFLDKESKKLQDILKLNHGNSKAYKDASKSLQDVQKEINNNIKSQDSLKKKIEDTTGEVEELEKSLNKAAKTAKGFETLDKVGKGLDKVQTPLDGMLNPLNLINKLMGFIFGTAVETDAQLGNAAKSMNMTYSAAAKSRGEMVRLANASGDLLLNSKNIEETTLAINESLGSNVAFENMSKSFQKDVGFLSKMSHYAGLTAEEANNIAKLTLATGQSAEKFTGELMGQVKVSGLQKGIILNEKTALKEISNTSAAIKMSFHGSAKGLAEAYAKSKALGASLEKVDDIAGSILNFEESIEAELSAELLTGRDLNLEKAREAALNNDIATVAEEIAKNVGSAADFAKMNRIQQDAIAKSVGMTREELASSLQEQESLKAIGAASLEDARAKYDKLRETMTAEEAIKALGDEQLASQFEQQSVQEKLGAAQLKMADETMPAMLKGLNAINANFQKMFDKVKAIFDMFGGMKMVLGVIAIIIAAKLVKGIFDFASGASKAIKAAKAMAAAEKGGAIASIIKGAWESLGPIPFVGAALATAAVGAGVAYLISQMNASNMSDGIIGPSGGGGFGDRVLFGPEGAISFNNKDTIVAGTNLFKANDMVSAPAGGISVGGGNRDMNELKGAIMALATRPVDVAIDGTKVIEATTGARPNTQGIESAKNSYKIQ